jgi:ATP phosphoribosyltransferase regulatory subunit
MARWLLPDGISDVLPEEAARLERLRRTLLDLYRGYGYELVVPPLLEYVESLATGVGEDLGLRTFKLVDQISGRMMGLRADTTPQVARIDAHILNRRGTTRLCYAASVLHAQPMHPLATREPFYIGAELYGHGGLLADAEVIDLAAASLKQAGVTAVQFDFGHTGVLRSVLQLDGTAQLRAGEIVAALSGKDNATLTQLTDGLSAPARRAILALPRLHGGVDVLADARAMLGEVAAWALDELEQLAGRMLRAGFDVNIDLADLHGFRYHTGLTFAAFARSWPVALARGGRYDDIGRAFGRARPATGFSIDLRELARLLGGMPTRAILAPAGDDPALLELIATLRSRGEVVVQMLDATDRIEGIEFTQAITRQDERWQLREHKST